MKGRRQEGDPKSRRHSTTSPRGGNFPANSIRHPVVSAGDFSGMLKLHVCGVRIEYRVAVVSHKGNVLSSVAQHSNSRKTGDYHTLANAFRVGNATQR